MYLKESCLREKKKLTLFFPKMSKSQEVAWLSLLVIAFLALNVLVKGSSQVGTKRKAKSKIYVVYSIEWMDLITFDFDF